MKKLFTALNLLVSITLFGQADTSQIKFIEPSDSTAIGTPDGKSVSKEMGITGGNIISEDGRVELIFPAGAVTTNTIISIQPTTNLAPNGSGKAYQFEPSGIQFKKPVEIIFHYTDEEAESCPPDLMGMGMQDHTGKWSFFEYNDWDSAAKTLKGSIRHFSTASNLKKMRLEVNKSTLIVNQKTPITIIDISRSSGFYNNDGDELFQSAAIKQRYANMWFVDEIQNGNYLVGNIESGIVSRTIGKYYVLWATYQAPSTLPDQNPVTVSVKILAKSRKNRTMNVLKELKCKIYIYDAYEIKVTGMWDNSIPGQTTGMWVDTSICSFRLMNYTTATKLTWHETKIVNSMLLWKKQYCQARCTCEYMNKDYCIGLVHITGIKSVGMLKSGPADKIVTVFFQPVKAIFPLVKATCPRGGNSYMPPMPSMPALPHMIKFKMKDGEQEPDLGLGTLGSSMQFKVVVRRLTE